MSTVSFPKTVYSYREHLDEYILLVVVTLDCYVSQTGWASLKLTQLTFVRCYVLFRYILFISITSFKHTKLLD